MGYFPGRGLCCICSGTYLQINSGKFSKSRCFKNLLFKLSGTEPSKPKPFCSKTAKSSTSKTWREIWKCHKAEVAPIAPPSWHQSEITLRWSISSPASSWKDFILLGENGSMSPKISTAVPGSRSLAALPWDWPWAIAGFAQDDLQAAHLKPWGSRMESDNARTGLISRNYGTITRHVFVQKTCSSLKPFASQEWSVPAMSSALCVRQLLLVLKLLLLNPHKTRSP